VTLVDTSVWLDHLNKGVPALSRLLEQDEVCTHPYVIGEIAMGKWKLRELTLALLNGLPRVMTARHEEVMHFVDEQLIYGSGIGYIDAHLLVAVRIKPGCVLWTRDRGLRVAAIALGGASTLV
jgi:predicted nucleic acid-binding protein